LIVEVDEGAFGCELYVRFGEGFRFRGLSRIQIIASIFFTFKEFYFSILSNYTGSLFKLFGIDNVNSEATSLDKKTSCFANHCFRYSLPLRNRG
jgi:hypothetical protein